MWRAGSKRGVVTLCIGGAAGAAGHQAQPGEAGARRAARRAGRPLAAAG
jgi:hypothetical protein